MSAPIRTAWASALSLAVLLALLASCATPADPQAGRLHYDPTPQADAEAAWQALARLAPSLTAPGFGDSSVSVHRTKGLVVFQVERTGYEYRSVDRSPWYPTGYPYCDGSDLMDDCPWPQTMRVKVKRTERVVFDPATLRSLELFTDNRLVLTHGPGMTLELAAPDRGTLLDLADALTALGQPHGFEPETGP